MPLPVHAIHPALASGASNRATRNCHNCSDPRLPAELAIPLDLVSKFSFTFSGDFSVYSTIKKLNIIKNSVNKVLHEPCAV